MQVRETFHVRLLDFQIKDDESQYLRFEISAKTLPSSLPSNPNYIACTRPTKKRDSIFQKASMAYHPIKTFYEAFETKLQQAFTSVT